MGSDGARKNQAPNQRPRSPASLPESQRAKASEPKANRLERARLTGSAIIAGVIAQRKFTLALMFGVSGIVALFIDKLTGDQFNFLVGIVLSIFGAANVMEKRGQ